jgi:hypothetical protein
VKYNREVLAPKLRVIRDDAKRKGCSICGYKKCLAALEYHPLFSKERAVSKSFHSIRKIKEEIKKCIVVCSNCHREIHEAERNK